MNSTTRPTNSFFPKKSLGQNFLVNPKVQEKIIAACNLSKEDIVLEIGPGKGALTDKISAAVKQVIAIEKDDYLAGMLTEKFEGTNVEIIHADVLEYSFEKLPDDLKIVGNLPYNIATPIIEKALYYRHKFIEFYMTVQLEYGNRLAAQPHSKDYGSLSCFVQYYADVKKCFKISPGSFSPVPKVDSYFLFLHIRPQPLYKTINEEFLFKLIRICFMQRRKVIRNSMSAFCGMEKAVEVLKEFNIDPNFRAEDLSLVDFVKIANSIHNTNAR